MTKIERTKSFLKDFKKCPKKIKEKIIERIDLFLTDSKNPLLNIHELSGSLKGIYSLNVTGDYRIWFMKEKEVFILLRVGTHSDLY